MRFAIATAALGCFWALLIAPARSSAQTSLDAFGALPIDHIASLGDSGMPVDFGGRVSFDARAGGAVVRRVRAPRQCHAAAGRYWLAFTRLDLTASAFYGEGGVRLLAAPHSAVTPYVEGTAGVAHLRFGASGFGSTTDAIMRAALNLVDTRDPLFGVGGGLLMQGGPLRFDVGYRYKRIMANNALSSFIGAGQQLQSHQIRFGAGVRF